MTKVYQPPVREVSFEERIVLANLASGRFYADGFTNLWRAWAALQTLRMAGHVDGLRITVIGRGALA